MHKWKIILVFVAFYESIWMINVNFPSFTKAHFAVLMKAEIFGI